MADLLKIVFAISVLLLGSAAFTAATAQCPAKTQVTDVLLNADGTPASGRVVIAWPTFKIGACQIIAGQATFTVTDGNFNAELFPNDQAAPEGTSYRVTYYLRSGRISTEYWVVPTSANPVALAMVRSPSAPVPSIMFSMAQVTDLPATLNQKIELPDPCPAGKFLQATGSSAPPQVSCVDGTGAPLASSTVSGTVKTDADETDPLVYTKASADTLLAGKADAAHQHAAADVTSGILDPARLPLPTATSAGGVLSGSCPGTDKVTGISAAGTVLCGADQGGGSASQHQLDGFNLLANDPVNFQDSATIDFFNPSAGNVQAQVKDGSINSAKLAVSNPTGAQLSGIGDANIADVFRLTGKSVTAPVKTGIAPPVTCQIGDLFYDADAPAGQNLYGCTATNVWSLLGDGGGSGTSHNLLSSTHTDTSVGTVTRGDLVVGNATPAWSRLAVGAAGTFLRSNGTDPAWQAIAPGDVPNLENLNGTLTVAKGGTGAASFPTNGVLLGNGTSSVVATAAGAADQVLRIPAAGGAPSFGAVNLSSSAAVSGVLSETNIDAAIARDSEIHLGNLGGGTAAANTYDFSGAAATLPVKAGTALPASCVATKELFLDTDAAAGQQLFVCNAAGNGWNLVGDGGGSSADTTKTHTLEMVCDTPRSSSLAGNSFWTVAGLTEWDWGHWEFVKDVDGKIYCHATIPETLATTPNAAVILRTAANATTGVTRLSIRSFVAGDGESLNPVAAAWAAAAAQDVAVPGIARNLKDVTFTTLPVLGARKILVVEVFHEGTHVNDTLAVNTELFKVLLRVDLTQ